MCTRNFLYVYGLNNLGSELHLALPSRHPNFEIRCDATERGEGTRQAGTTTTPHCNCNPATCTTLPCCLCTYVCTSSSAKRAKVSYYRRGEKPMPITRIPAYPPFLESIVSLTHVWLHWCIKCARENLIVMM